MTGRSIYAVGPNKVIFHMAGPELSWVDNIPVNPGVYDLPRLLEFARPTQDEFTVQRDTFLDQEIGR